MQRSMAVVVAVGLLSASQRSSTVLGADVASGCAGGACLDGGFEEAALVQRKVQEHRQKVKLDDGHTFPDLGGLKDSVKESIDKVTDTVSDLGVDALTTFAETLNDRLEDTKDAVESYSKEVNSSVEDLKRGVAAMLAEAFNVTIEGIPKTEKYNKKAMDLIAKADVVWSALSKSVQAAVTAIDSGLSMVGLSADDLRQRVNATMQAALSGSKGVLESIKAVKNAIQEAQKEVKSKAKEAASDEDKDDSLLQTKLDPSSLLEALNNAIAEASNQASAFAETFSESFGTLSKEITDSAQDKLSADNLSEVHKSFKKVQQTATELASEVLAASKKIFAGITEASAAAGDAAGVKSGAVQQPLARWGLGVVAVAAVAAISI